MTASSEGGRFEFEDGGVYCGEWEEGKAHGFGVCTGPKGEGEYSGAYNYGFEVSGLYTISNGSILYSGQWQNGKKHGLGVEKHSRYVYRGEWTQGIKGRYGVRQSRTSQARYEGTWSDGLQDGYGTETYADGGTYQGQWLRGMRHGYGIRRSVPYGLAAQFKSKGEEHESCNSLLSEPEGRQIISSSVRRKKSTPPRRLHAANQRSERSRGGFVLRAHSTTESPGSTRRSQSEQSIGKRRFLQGLRIKKQRSTGDIDRGDHHDTGRSLRSSGSSTSCNSEESTAHSHPHPHPHPHPPSSAKLSQDPSFEAEENIDPTVTETYLGEWKNDKRSGFGISERSDGLKYEGEWFNNKKYGFGVTTLRDGTKEEGKYKNNCLVTSGGRKRHALFVLRSSKLRDRIDAAVVASAKAAHLALQKADVAAARTGTAQERAHQADSAADQARDDSEKAQIQAAKYGIALPSGSVNRVNSQTAKDPLQSRSRTFQSVASTSNHVQFECKQTPQDSPNAQTPSQDLGPPSQQSGTPATFSPSSSTSSNAPRSSRPRFIPKFETLPSESPSDESQRMVTPPTDLPPGHSDPYSSRSADFAPYGSGGGNPTVVSHQPQPLGAKSYVQKPSTSTHHYHVSYGSPEAYDPQAPPFAQGPPSHSHSLGLGGNPPDRGYAATTSSRDRDREPSVERYLGPFGEVYLANPQSLDHRLYAAGHPHFPSSTSASLNQALSLMQKQQQQQQHHAMNPRRHPDMQPGDTDSTATSQGGTPGLRYRSNPSGNWHNSSDREFMTEKPVRKRRSGHHRVSRSQDRTLLRHSYAAQPDFSDTPYGWPSQGLNPHASFDQSANPGYWVPPGLLLQQQRSMDNDSSMGSLPDLTRLGQQEIYMTREEASRLSSAQRQEILRRREQEELMRQNPLLYLSHPKLRGNRGYANGGTRVPRSAHHNQHQYYNTITEEEQYDTIFNNSSHAQSQSNHTTTNTQDELWLYDQRFFLAIVVLNIILGLVFYYLLRMDSSEKEES